MGVGAGVVGVVGVGAGVVGSVSVCGTVDRSGSSFSPQPRPARPRANAASATAPPLASSRSRFPFQRHHSHSGVFKRHGTVTGRDRRLLPAAALAVSLLVAPAGAQAATGFCDGASGQVRNAKVIRGGPGDDVLIGAGRDQKVLAGAGDDRVCTGGGNDVVRGGPGDDIVHGDGRGDRLFGEAGADRLYGDILDDHLFGGSGDDALLGGHGVDKMYGGEGNDLLRGGTNRDCFYGEAGANTASFATATPPGEGGSGTTAGVVVDLAAPIKGGCPRRGTGRADGDGAGEALSGIQFVVGSAFDDSAVRHGRGRGGRRLRLGHLRGVRGPGRLRTR